MATISLGTESLVVGADHLDQSRFFILVNNESPAPQSADISAARLFVNGVALDSEPVRALLGFNKGAPALPPKAHFTWGGYLSLVASKPGFYRLQLKGPGIASNEARVLVLPKKPK